MPAHTGAARVACLRLMADLKLINPMYSGNQAKLPAAGLKSASREIPK
jgi:hypothetical protein